MVKAGGITARMVQRGAREPYECSPAGSVVHKGVGGICRHVYEGPLQKLGPRSRGRLPKAAQAIKIHNEVIDWNRIVW